jgi:hypothetical protein
MKMIRQEAIRVDLPAALAARLGQGFQKAAPILTVVKDGFPSVPTVHDVVNRAGILNSQLARHATGIITKLSGL